MQSIHLGCALKCWYGFNIECKESGGIKKDPKITNKQATGDVSYQEMKGWSRGRFKLGVEMVTTKQSKLCMLKFIAFGVFYNNGSDRWGGISVWFCFALP